MVEKLLPALGKDDETSAAHKRKMAVGCNDITGGAGSYQLSELGGKLRNWCLFIS
jgi:hypothetical protein